MAPPPPLLSTADVRRIQSAPPSHHDNIKEGPVSTVARIWTSTAKDGQPEWVVVKSAPVVRRFSREPHDIVKELRLLSTLQSPNIIQAIGSFIDDDAGTPTLRIYLPHVPIALSDLLASPHFSPHPFPPPSFTASPAPSPAGNASLERQFTTIARSLLFQLLCALAYLHDPRRGIAHRDIKPDNVLITKEGCVKLVDFGVSYQPPDAAQNPGRGSELGLPGDLWPETKERMYFEVCTGAYRAPELLFGTRTYDAAAVDLWSLGATFAEFFTPLRLCSSEEDYDSDEDEDNEEEEDHECGEDGECTSTPNGLTNGGEAKKDVEAVEKAPKPPQPFIVPRYLRIGYPGAQWRRETLFNGDRGEIGLAWSIFKIYGTPTHESWPEFDDLPGAKSVVFNVVPPVPVEPMLPNLPPSTLTPPMPTSSASAPAQLSSATSPPAAKPPSAAPAPPPLLSRSSTSASTATMKPASSSVSIAVSATAAATAAAASATLSTPTSTAPLAPTSEWLPSTDPTDPPHLTKPKNTPFDLLSRFLRYPPAERLSAARALGHPWIVEPGEGVLLVPRGWEGEMDFTIPHPAFPSSSTSTNSTSTSKTESKNGPKGSAKSMLFTGPRTNGGSDTKGARSGEGVVDVKQRLRELAVCEWEGKDLGEWLESVVLAIPGSAAGRQSS